MCPVLVAQFHFEVFILEAEGDGKEFHYFYIHFLPNVGVLGSVWKAWFIAFRTIFQCVNVASIDLTISFGTFDPRFMRTWESISLFLHPFSAQFWCSLVHLKAVIYSFQDHFSTCKCGQYWSSHLFTLLILHAPLSQNMYPKPFTSYIFGIHSFF